MVAVLVMVAWVAQPISAIMLVKAAWWTWGENASTPLDKVMLESGTVVVVAGGVDSTLTATI